MRPLLICLALSFSLHAADDFPLGPDSKPQDGIAKGTLIKDTHRAAEISVFPGTEREYTIYLPAGFDKTKPAAFMVFQDGVIYQAPVVFDNLIAKKDIPPLVGVFIRPGVVPAANENALPRFNRSYEYDSITPTYSQFLINELLPAIEAKHGLQFSKDPNQTAIAGNSSGGICAFMVAWHRPDRFRRVFTGVGTYVGIHGADQLPVLVRKFEPKPLRIFLQSGTGDNNLYCGDWWMANQMMERSLTWAGYDVNHAWGEGGHNQKHASQIFPDVMRWLWRDWQTNIEVKANPKGESKWKGYEVVGAGEWEKAADLESVATEELSSDFVRITSNKDGVVFVSVPNADAVCTISPNGDFKKAVEGVHAPTGLAIGRNGELCIGSLNRTEDEFTIVLPDGKRRSRRVFSDADSIAMTFNGTAFIGGWGTDKISRIRYDDESEAIGASAELSRSYHGINFGTTLRLALSPDQSLLYSSSDLFPFVLSHVVKPDGSLVQSQEYFELYSPRGTFLAVGGLCVDANGWLYVTTSLGIQVCDQAGRVNFILPMPEQPTDVCFGGKDLSELFIACGHSIYKRPTEAKGVVSGQQAPIKPAAPKL